MRVNLQQVKDASQCFRYETYLRSDYHRPKNQLTETIESVIKKAYLQATETGFRANWRRIVGWVDRQVYESIDVNNIEQTTKAKKHSESCLEFLSKWNSKIYEKDHCAAYAEVALIGVLDDFEIETVAPIMKVTEPLSIVVVSSVVRSETQLYNDIGIRGLAWLVAESLDCDTVNIDELCIRERGGFSCTTISLSSDAHEGTKDMIRQVVTMMAAGANFPSVTEKCNNCPFKRRCII